MNNKKQHKTNHEDQNSWLEERLVKYDSWMKAGKVPFISKVIPINKSLDYKQWILPTAQVIDILRNARIFLLIDCECRTLFKRCNNPINVCFLVNDAADESLKKGEGRKISIEEAKTILEKANENGLVHMTIYSPEQYICALCSCCLCCCGNLQLLKKFNRRDFIAHSDYIAITDFDKCTSCGICTDRCIFDARAIKNNELIVAGKQCYGCGLCVTTCPQKAIAMEIFNQLK